MEQRLALRGADEQRGAEDSFTDIAHQPTERGGHRYAAWKLREEVRRDQTDDNLPPQIDGGENERGKDNRVWRPERRDWHVASGQRKADSCPSVVTQRDQKDVPCIPVGRGGRLRPITVRSGRQRVPRHAPPLSRRLRTAQCATFSGVSPARRHAGRRDFHGLYAELGLRRSGGC